jgi:predicted ATPase
MLLEQITLENLFSFEKTTVELRALNVLIGANASGETNLIEAMGLLQAAPIDLSTAVRRLGGIRVVCSLGGRIASPIAAIDCEGLLGEQLRYRLEFSEEAGGFVILSERLGSTALAAGGGSDVPYFERVAGKVRFGTESSAMPPSQSVFEVHKSPADPTPITRIGRELEATRIYREFHTTGDSQVGLAWPFVASVVEQFPA